MARRQNRINWAEFMACEPVSRVRGKPHDALRGKTVLVTGAGGYIGMAVAESLADAGARRTILLDHCEQALHTADRHFCAHREKDRYRAILGDAGDSSLLTEIFETHQPEIVFHAAAFKHLPLMESHPLEAVRNNALATFRLAQVAARSGPRKVVLISTDKAATPTSVMGASKRVAELALLSLSNSRTLMTAVRLGNVLGSPGSVVPLFVEQVARGGPVTVTHREAARFFVTLEGCVHHILRAAEHRAGPCVLIPEMGPPHTILDLAHFLMKEAGTDVPVELTGLRPGEKIHERLTSENEKPQLCGDCGLSRVDGPALPAGCLEALMMRLEECVAERDVAGLLRSLCDLIPEYRPSDHILALAGNGRVLTKK